MRVLLVIPALAPIYGGPSKIASALAAALGRRPGVAVDLITTNATGSGNLSVSGSEWQEINADYRVRYFRRLGRSEYKICPSLLFWMLRNVKQYDAVWVISNFNFPVLACALACRANQVPYFVNPQGMLEPWALDYKGWKKQAYFGWIERPLVLKGAIAIQALNAREAGNIEKLNLGPSVVRVPNGVDLAETEQINDTDVEAFFSRFPETRGKTLILFMHRIDPKKGLDLLARAFATVQTRFERTHLVIAGPDNVDFTGTARGFFAAAGVQDDAVSFTGMLEGPLKRGALRAATIFVLPSYSEGFSMAVLEAMAAGLPCVITTACNFPEAGEAGAAKVVPVEAEPFAEAVVALLASPGEAAEMGQRARTLVLKDYTWDSIAERLVTILETRVMRRKYG